MATNQYHEPPDELSRETRDFARIITSLTEEAEAINWYQQRISVTGSKEVADILKHAQDEEIEHFSIDLAWLVRRLPKWKEVLGAVLLKEGSILENVERYEVEEKLKK